MRLLPVSTPLIRAGDDIAAVITACSAIEDGDIVVVSSKAVATAEGNVIHVKDLAVSDEAQRWSVQTGRSPGFMQAVMNETARLGGAITGHCPGALLTELRPAGLRIGSIFAPNAGMDESNIDDGCAVGWPLDPVKSAQQLKMALMKTMAKIQDPPNKIQTNYELQATNCKPAVIISDSCCRPRRLGVTAFALAVAGLDPLKSEIGARDLFGHELRVTVEATADQLATAANMLMGNAAQSTPVVIIRDHGVTLNDNAGWVDGIEPDEDLFSAILR